MRVAEACVVQMQGVRRAGGDGVCAMQRAKCRCGAENEMQSGEENKKKKDRFVRIDPSWSSEAGD